MATYVYECRAHGQVEVDKPMAESGREEYCLECLIASGTCLVTNDVVAGCRMRRIFTPQGFILRPSGWHLRPGDRGYANFNRELELGEVRGPSHERTPVVADEPDKPVAVVVPEQRLQEIHELGRVVDRQIREEMALPSAVLDLV